MASSRSAGREVIREAFVFSFYRHKSSKTSSGPDFVGIKVCLEWNNMLYPREDKESRQLLYACRNSEHKQVADNPCIYVNELMHEIDELTQIVADVIHDPTLPRITRARSLTLGRVGGTNRSDGAGNVYAALMSNIWDIFERQGVRDQLKKTVIECEHGTVVVVRVAAMLLAILSDGSVPLGVLKSKIHAFAEHLSAPLSSMTLDIPQTVPRISCAPI
ncbi:CRE-RPB-9 protein [Aphelenchoides avenae]|nr:CRE-RPB-9 protein [Aphelenchus avenae]